MMRNIEISSGAFFYKCPICGSALEVERERDGVSSTCPVCKGSITPKMDLSSGIKVAKAASEINGISYDNEKYQCYPEEDMKACNACSEKSNVKRWVYILLGFFIGVLGFHDLYAKRYNHAITMFVLCIVFVNVAEKLMVLLAGYVIYELFTVFNDGDGKVMR